MRRRAAPDMCLEDLAERRSAKQELQKAKRKFRQGSAPGESERWPGRLAAGRTRAGPPSEKCLPKAGGCVMLETKKEERERYGRNAHSLKTSHKHVFSQWGLAPLFVLGSGGCCRAFPFLGTAWNYAATCISGPFCAQTRPSGTFCKGREVLLCRKFCCLQTI